MMDAKHIFNLLVRGHKLVIYHPVTTSNIVKKRQHATYAFQNTLNLIGTQSESDSETRNANIERDSHRTH